MSYLKTELPSLQQAQAEFALALPQGRALLIDQTLGRVASAVRTQTNALLQTPDLAPEVVDYLTDVKQFGLPNNTFELYQQFFGPNLPMKAHEVTETASPNLSQISCVILTGSPANISMAVNDPTTEVAPGHPHRGILNRAEAIVQAALDKRIPILGMCYGHQLMSYVMGGAVHRFSSPTMGLAEMSITPQGQTRLNQWGVDSKLLTGSIPAFHQDYVELSTRSQSLFEADLKEGRTNYVALHEQSALTVQYHPEYWWAEPLLTSLRTNTPLRPLSSGLASINTLRLFSAWLRSR